MLRKTMLALAALALLGLAAAQITIAPTGSNGNDQIAKGTTSAAVDQTVVLTLPQATALHLAANTITFDLNYLDGDFWDDRAFGDLTTLPTDAYACVYVSGDDDVLGPLGSEFWGQTQFVPGGIAYEAATWPTIELIYFGNGKSGPVPDSERVVTYPPIRIDPTTGMLVEGSKGYFVCYQTFVIQMFSNFEHFHLQVARNDLTDQGITHLYVQGNPCAEFGTPTGLYDLPDDAFRELLPKSLTVGPTGTRVCDVNSSWTDLLGVLAVKLNSDLYGDSVANLTYTLLSSDTGF
jgi:hypothetical protein